MNDLIGRLSRLELQQAKLQRSNKLLRLMTSVLMLLCGALITMGQTNSAIPDTLQAQQFVLRDSSGNVRGAMGITSDGAVGLNFEDSKGHTRVTLDLAANGTPGFGLFRSGWQAARDFRAGVGRRTRARSLRSQWPPANQLGCSSSSDSRFGILSSRRQAGLGSSLKCVQSNDTSSRTIQS